MSAHVRLVVCEGAHDLWVMQRVLERLHHYQKLKLSLSGLPQPLGSFIQKQVEKHYLTVQASHVMHETPHFSLAMKHPDSDFIFAFFTANGGLASPDCKAWLNDLRLALGTRLGSPGAHGNRIQSASVCVVVDADDDPAKAKSDVDAWWGSSVPLRDYVASSTPPTEVALWIWPDGKGAEFGTLETVLDELDGGPCVEPSNEIVKLLDEHAPSGCEYLKGGKSIAVCARRTKARLGVRAQWKAPGGSWATWLRDEGLSDTFIDKSDVLKDLGRWLVEKAP